MGRLQLVVPNASHIWCRCVRRRDATEQLGFRIFGQKSLVSMLYLIVVVGVFDSVKMICLQMSDVNMKLSFCVCLFSSK